MTQPPGASPQPLPPEIDGALPELRRDQGWQRLDPKMLLVHPARQVVRFLPALVGLLVAGGFTSGAWQFFGIVVPVGLGLLTYLTTTFRVADGRVELRRGLLNRRVTSTPVDRVRTIDLTSSLIQRALGLTTVRIGTGVTSGDNDDRLDLDGLPVARAHELRGELLRVAQDPTPEPSPFSDGSPTATPYGATSTEGEPVARFRWAWLRFAPFTSSGFIIAAGTVGLLSQVGNDTGLFERLLDPLDRTGRGAPTVVVVVLAVVALLVVVSAFAVLGYLLANWDFTLRRTAGRDGQAWSVRRGLLTTRETTLDEDRIAGVVVGEPAALRAVGGRRLSAVATGLATGQRAAAGLMPPAPRADVTQAAAAVLGSTEPMAVALVPHGPAATRRRWVRALVPAAVLAATGPVIVAAGGPTWAPVSLVLLLPGVLLAADRSRSLGHALLGPHLVSRSGSLTRSRTVLEVEHVIGWNLQATWFQRRVGLTTLIATTAGGSQRVVLLDVPEDVAVALAARAHPALVPQFAG